MVAFCGKLIERVLCCVVVFPTIVKTVCSASFTASDV